MTRLMQTRFYIVLTAALAFSITFLWSQSSTSSARFIIVSDLGGQASNDQKAVAAAMGKEASRIKAQFVVTAGDNYHENGIATATDERWQTQFEDVYSATSLQIPWYPSLGNHDYRGNVDGEIDHSRLSARWKLPARYYAQTEKVDDSTSLLIVHIDTSPFVTQYRVDPDEYHVKGRETRSQVIWLDSVLRATSAKWKIVVGHHPIYSAAAKHGNTQELIDQVLPVVKQYKVALYVCGHDHIFQHLKHDGMDFVICGVAAKHREPDQRDDVLYGSSSLGFVSALVTSTQLRLAMIDTSSTILHTVEINAPAVR